MTFKWPKLAASLVIFFSALLVLHATSKSGDYQRVEEKKAQLTAISLALEDLNREDYLSIERKDLNKFYNVNKRAHSSLAKNYLNDDLMKLREFVLKRPKKDLFVRTLDSAVNEINYALENLRDRTIRKKFENIKLSVIKAQKIDSHQRLSLKIQEITKDVEQVKNQLRELGKVKPQESRVISSFNKVLVFLDQTQVALAPWIESANLNTSIKKHLENLRKDIAKKQYELDVRSKTTFNYIVQVLSLSALIFSAVMATAFVFFGRQKKNNVAKTTEEYRPTAFQLHSSEEGVSKLILAFIAENTSSFLALTDKKNKIVWSSKKFKETFSSNGESDWSQIKNSNFESEGKSYFYQLKNSKYILNDKELQSLRFGHVIELNEYKEGKSTKEKDSNSTSTMIRRDSLVEMEDILEVWKIQMKELLATLGVEINYITNDGPYTKISENTLLMALKQLSQALATYTQARRAGSILGLEWQVSSHKFGQNLTLKIFVPGLKFERVNNTLAVGTKVHPSLSSKLRKIEEEYAHYKTTIRVKNVFKNDKSFKGGVILMEMLDESFSQLAAPRASSNSAELNS